MLVNGICTKGNNYDKEYIEELTKLFQNATIFNGELEIIHTPQKEKSTQGLVQESIKGLPDLIILDDIEQTKERQQRATTNQREEHENAKNK